MSTNSLEVDICIIDEQSDLSIDPLAAQKVVLEVMSFENIRCNEVAIHFVDLEKICKLHAEYFDDPTPTDCISFPIDAPNSDEFCLLGEVFVCPKTAINYAKDNNMDPFAETTLYLVHGLLHLFGFDDIEEPDAKLMRIAEKRHMENLCAKNLILTKKAP